MAIHLRRTQTVRTLTRMGGFKPSCRTIVLMAGLAAATMSPLAMALEQPNKMPEAPASAVPGKPVVNKPSGTASMPATTNTPAPTATAPGSSAPAAPAGSAASAAVAKGSFRVSRFIVEYANMSSGMPAEDVLARNAKVGLNFDGNTYSAPATGNGDVIRTIAELNTTPAAYDVSAISAVCKAIVGELNNAGYAAIFVVPSPKDIDDNGGDIRQGRDEMVLTVVPGRVDAVRATRLNTANYGFLDFAPGGSVNRVKNNSPIKSGDAVDKAKLDEYVYRLNRHPGRRVDVALSGATASPSGSALDKAFDVNVDYLINEGKPWTIYFQVANNGTDATQPWRQRVGFLNNNLTGNDDILLLDYNTAGFKDSHNLAASYDFRIAEPLRAKVYGSWNSYTASDVGFNFSNFKGDGYSIGGELVWNVLQRREWFIDLVGGVRYDHTKVTQEIIPGFEIVGDGGWTLPYAGFRAGQQSDSYNLGINASFETTASSPDQAEVNRMGRFNADRDFSLLKAGIESSFYLEPLFNRGTPTTLAHEIYVGVRGQYAFNDRLPPMYQAVDGGMYTVRGYEESVVSGDNSVIGSVEYRLHVPRLYKPYAEGDTIPVLFGEQMRWRPTEAFGRPDWDLILKAFCDVGNTTVNNKAVFESDYTLASVGFGAELQIRHNIAVRADWGYVLNEAIDAAGTVRAENGDNRFHFVFTLSF